MPYSESALTQLTTLKDWLSIPSTDTSGDAALTSLIQRASVFVCRLISRDQVFSASVTETRSGNDQKSLVLAVRPVSAVASVFIDGVSIPLSVNRSAGYVWDDRKIQLIGYKFNAGANNVVVTYTGGIGQTHPDVYILEQAVLELCTQKWRRRDHVDMTSQSLNGMQTVAFSLSDLPNEVRLALSNLKNVVPV